VRDRTSKMTCTLRWRMY